MSSGVVVLQLMVYRFRRVYFLFCGYSNPAGAFSQDMDCRPGCWALVRAFCAWPSGYRFRLCKHGGRYCVPSLCILSLAPETAPKDNFAGILAHGGGGNLGLAFLGRILSMLFAAERHCGPDWVARR